jgi:hypothetical protein
MPEIAGQRPAPASLTRGKINDFHRPGKISQETELPGWGTWIRTKINGVRVRSGQVTTVIMTHHARVISTG